MNSGIGRMAGLECRDRGYWDQGVGVWMGGWVCGWVGGVHGWVVGWVGGWYG